MKKIVSFVCLLLATGSIYACTSVIISSKRTESGVALMMKNRDTDCLDNRLAWFQVGDFRFVGLVNAPVDSGEVWAGTNNYGFSIMNTAVYNFNEDSLTAVYQDELYHVRKDSTFCANALAQLKADSMLLKKMKDQIHADTLRVHFHLTMDSLRYALAEHTAHIHAVNRQLTDWTATVAANPSLVKPVPFADREGQVMFQALATCKTVQDFLNMLDTLPKPLGVEANFGVIDSIGGALYVETNNWRHVVFDVNDEPLGYRVQTNFAFSGKREGYKGYERYLTAEAIMADLDKHFSHQPIMIGHQWLINHISRSYRHEVLGHREGYYPSTGIVVDQDYIPRISTSASVVFEGPAMWTVLGYPACGVALPAIVADKDRLPAEMKRSANDSTCVLSNLNMQIKMQHVFADHISNGKHYVHLTPVLRGTRQVPSLYDCAMKTEDKINQQWNALYLRWKKGNLTDEQFYREYEQMLASFPALYMRNFKKYLEH